jgi:small subunit ribosomal protein S6
LAATREYELVLMLDAGRDAPARDTLAQEAKGMIESGGTLKHENNWGLRKMAYEIDRQNEADYRWFRFEAPNDVLEKLDHNLKIADGVLRFRVFKVDPEAPVIVPPAVAAPTPGRDRDDRGERGDRGDRPAPPQEKPAEEPQAESTEATPPEAASAEESEPDTAPAPETAGSPDETPAEPSAPEPSE